MYAAICIVSSWLLFSGNWLPHRAAPLRTTEAAHATGDSDRSRGATEGGSVAKMPVPHKAFC